MNFFILFWLIGIAFSSLFYIFGRKYFSIQLKDSLLYSLFFLIFEIIGAKVLFILENIKDFDITFLQVNGGFSLFGVFIFTPIFILFLLKFLNVKNKGIIFDYFIIGMFIELFFYRIGCICSGCCGGLTINILNNVFVFPTRELEMIFCLFIIYFLIKLHSSRTTPMIGFSISYITYGLFRFVIEFFRIRENIFSIFSIAHIFSILCFVFGMLLLISLEKKNKRDKLII